MLDLDALEALLEKATPGEWTASGHDWFALRTHALIICDRPPVFYAESHAAWPDNSTAVAALHNAAPALIAELRTAREALRRVHEGASRQLAEPRNHDDDQYALVAIATIAEGDEMPKRTEAANRWRPIAETPSPNRVELWWPYWTNHVVTGFIRQDGLWVSDCQSSDDPELPGPTHWRPLSDPPEGA